MSNDVEIKEVAPVKALTFSKTFETGNFEAMAYFGSLVMKAVGQAGLKPVGPFTNVFAETDDNASVNVTMAVPVDEAPDDLRLDANDYLVKPEDVLRLETVAGLPTAATCTFEGSEVLIPENVARLKSWIVENGYRQAREFRLVILRGPMHRMPDGRRVYPDDMIWEVQQGI